MKRTPFIILIFFSILFLVSCKGMFRNGETVTLERSIKKFFNRIQVNDNVNVTLKESNSNNTYVEVTSGEFVIDKLITEVIGDTMLVVRNDNRFDWLRSYDCPFEVTVYYTNLGTIDYQSTGTLKSLDSIKGIFWGIHRRLIINILEGSGDIDLIANCDNVIINYQHGTSKVNISGKAEWSELYTLGFGPIEAENLISKSTSIESTSTCYARVCATKTLNALLYGIDYVYYKGDPDEINCNDYSKLKKL